MAALSPPQREERVRESPSEARHCHLQVFSRNDCAEETMGMRQA